jgi:hypothetical protein
MSLIGRFTAKSLIPQCAPVAQLDRAFDYESKGRVFESRRAHHLILRFIKLTASLATLRFHSILVVPRIVTKLLREAVRLSI